VSTFAADADALRTGGARARAGDAALDPNPAFAALALFEGLPLSQGSNYGGDLASGRLDAALLLCSTIATGADAVLVMYASLESRARLAIVAAMRQWFWEFHVRTPDTPAEAWR
jgi:hypothetical protein